MNDVGLIGVSRRVILVIVLGDVEGFERFEGCRDRITKDTSFVQLSNVSIRDSLLFFIGVEDRGPILTPEVVSLPIQLGRIVRD